MAAPSGRVFMFIRKVVLEAGLKKKHIAHLWLAMGYR